MTLASLPWQLSGLALASVVDLLACAASPVERGLSHPVVNEATETPASPSPETSNEGTRVYEVAVGRATLHVHLDPSAFQGGSELILAWLKRAALAVSNYYGEFPAPEVDVYVATFDGQGVGNGRVIIRRGRPTVLIAVGESTTPARLERDWVLTHELVHLGFPTVPDQHHWIEEGLATYVEPIARARIGWRTEQDVWLEWIESMHQGLPEAGDRGLDHTPTWGRTYWGGALFCLLADVEIRKRSDNRYGLRHALRAIVKHGGRIDENWPIEQALAVGDRAIGMPVLQELYEQMRAEPFPVDLEALWRELGVEKIARTGDTSAVAFDDRAPLAAVRRALILGD